MAITGAASLWLLSNPLSKQLEQTGLPELIDLDSNSDSNLSAVPNLSEIVQRAKLRKNERNSSLTLQPEEAIRRQAAVGALGLTSELLNPSGRFANQSILTAENLQALVELEIELKEVLSQPRSNYELSILLTDIMEGLGEIGYIQGELQSELNYVFARAAIAAANKLQGNRMELGASKSDLTLVADQIAASLSPLTNASDVEQFRGNASILHSLWGLQIAKGEPISLPPGFGRHGGRLSSLALNHGVSVNLPPVFTDPLEDVYILRRNSNGTGSSFVPSRLEDFKMDSN